MAVWPKERVVRTFLIRKLWWLLWKLRFPQQLSTEDLLLSWTQDTWTRAHATEVAVWGIKILFQPSRQVVLGVPGKCLQRFALAYREWFLLVPLYTVERSGAGPCRTVQLAQCHICARTLGHTHVLHLSTVCHGMTQLSAPPSHSWPLEIPAKTISGNNLSIQDLLLERQFRVP